MLVARVLLVSCVLAALIGGCSQDSQTQSNSGKGSVETPKAASTAQPKPSDSATAPMTQAAAPQALAPRLPDPLRGTAKETMNSGGYTYILMDTEQGEVWAAARQLTVAVGDEVEVSVLMPMTNFRSATLNRTFPVIQFVSGVRVIGADSTATAPQLQPGAMRRGMPPGHPAIGEPATPPATGAPIPAPGKIEVLADGVTVVDLFDKRADLQGKPVKFRGQVVKANQGILGKNWMHVQDGTGVAGTNDITVTSETDFAPPGAVVVIEGTLALDKDFGAGYRYDVIVENATITVEPAAPATTEPTD